MSIGHPDPAPSAQPLRVLYIADDHAAAEPALAVLRRTGRDVVADLAPSRDAFIARLAAGHADLILSAYHLSRWNGLDALVLARERAPDLPFILVSDPLGEEAAIACLRRGASDLVRTDQLARLPGLVAAALAERGRNAERRRARQALVDSERRLRALVAAGYNGTATLIDGLVVEADRPFATLFGYEPEAMVGVRLLDLVAPDSRTAVASWLLAGEGGRLAFVARTRAGRWLELEAVGTRETGAGRATQLVALSDQTERRERERQTLQAQRLEAVGQVAGSIAHDFNNILTSVVGFSQFLIDQLPEGHPLRADAEEIFTAGETAAALTRKLLVFSRRSPGNPVVLDLNNAINEGSRMLRRLLGSEIQLAIETRAEPAFVHADPGLVEQVVLNLAVNAREAMPRGGPLRIQTATQHLKSDRLHSSGVVPAGRYVMLTVADEGIGMSPEVQSRIFEPFFTTKEPAKGAGLGLATVYGIVRQSRGHVVVQSAPNRGTTIDLYFPLAEPEALPKVTRPLGAAWGNETILVVDDQPGIRTLAQRVLVRGGYAVLLAEHGEEARAVAKAHDGPIHLILMDVQLPGERGPRVVADLLRKYPAARVAFISGHNDLGEEPDLPKGPYSFLRKPFGPDQLLMTVRSALDAKPSGLDGTPRSVAAGGPSS